MPTISELWDKLPSFIRKNLTVRAEIKDNSAEINAYTHQEPWKYVAIDKANMLTSEWNGSADGSVFHMPVLDIDFEAALIPSSTPGHYHLLMDRVMSKEIYMNLLKALAEAGIIQWGFYEGAKKRGASSVRLPWIKKGDKAANSLDPDVEVKKIKAAIEYHEAMLKQLRDKLPDAGFKAIGYIPNETTIEFTYDPSSEIAKLLTGELTDGLSVSPIQVTKGPDSSTFDEDDVAW